MLSTKTRTTIVALVASLSFAATTVAPAVSQARPKGTTTKKVTLRQVCNGLADSMHNAEEEARNYEKAGDTKNAEASWAASNIYFEVWSDNGCQGAAVTLPVKMTPVSGINAKSGAASR